MPESYKTVLPSPLLTRLPEREPPAVEVDAKLLREAGELLRRIDHTDDKKDPVASIAGARAHVSELPSRASAGTSHLLGGERWREWRPWGHVLAPQNPRDAAACRPQQVLSG